MAVRVVMMAGGINSLIRPGGPVDRNMYTRARRVRTAARALAPKDTGALATSIMIRRGTSAITGTRGYEIGSDLTYAKWVHGGTGIYGPGGGYIYPRSRKYMTFQPKGSSETVYANRVRGIRGTPFLTIALQAAR